ncbi:MAG TPA: glycosyl transferase family protein, partial [Alphaproteobacteria bacterium]|nr:glycosyl transferase family protein [Alphaproteobacteria bacterium]
MAEEHPFAQYVRILGRGPGRSRALTQDEARAAMRMIIAGEAEPAQIGALLMLMRYRQESPEELAGFVEALRESISLATPRGRVDLDWPSYAAGRTRGEPWFLLSALLLAENGIRVLMHAPGRAGSALVIGLTALGLPSSGTDAERSVDEDNFAFLPLRAFCPALEKLLDLRRILGLRSAANSVARLINPFGAPSVMQGVFHPAYRDLQRSAGALLGQKNLAVFKGGGGEAERNPDKPCRVFSLQGGAAFDEEWPALTGERT